MANFKTSLLIIAIAICSVAKTHGSTITCNFLSTPVYEGDTKVTLSCILNDINIDNAVTVKRNGTEVTPRITLDAITTYEVPNTRYIVRTTAPEDRGDSTEIGYFFDITNVTRGDDGWYVLELLSDASSNTIISIKTEILSVYYLPDGSPICSPDDDVYVVLGHEFQLVCTSPVGKPSDSISLQWEYQSTILPGATTISNGAVTNNASFRSASVETVYVTCSMKFDQLFQDEPARTCQAGPIHFIDDPIVSVKPGRLTLLPSEDALFTCNIVNDPIAARIWLHRSISSDRLVQTGTNNKNVSITNVQLQDSGKITCRVKTGASPYAYEEGFAQLIITESPPPTTRPATTSNQPPQSTSITTKQLDVTSGRTTDGLKTSTEPKSTMSTDKRPMTKTERSSTPKAFVSENSSEQSPALPSSAIIGIIVCIILIILIVIIVLGLLLWKSRRRDDSHGPERDRDELQSPPAQNGQLSGTVVYADLDLMDTAPGTAVRPLSEEPTVYASLKQQKAENIYVEN